MRGTWMLGDPLHPGDLARYTAPGHHPYLEKDDLVIVVGLVPLADTRPGLWGYYRVVVPGGSQREVCERDLELVEPVQPAPPHGTMGTPTEDER